MVNDEFELQTNSMLLYTYVPLPPCCKVAALMTMISVYKMTVMVSNAMRLPRYCATPPLQARACARQCHGASTLSSRAQRTILNNSNRR